VGVLALGLVLVSPANSAKPKPKPKPDWRTLVGNALCKQGPGAQLYQVPRSVTLGRARAGFRKVGGGRCRVLLPLGAKAGVETPPGYTTVKWVFVSLKREPAVRGWVFVYDFNYRLAKVDWSKVPKIAEDVLYRTGDWHKDIAQAICFDNIDLSPAGETVQETDRGATIYRAPSLAGGNQGYQLIQQGLACGTYEAAGVSPVDDTDYGPNSPIRWALVTLRADPSVKGWTTLSLYERKPRPPVNFDWAQVTAVAPEALFPSSGLPDLGFGGAVPDRKAGDPCSPRGAIFTAGWNVTIVNRGAGIAPSSLTISWRGQPTTYQFKRGILPGESVVRNYQGEASLVLDPGGVAPESDEGNNFTALPKGATFTCG